MTRKHPWKKQTLALVAALCAPLCTCPHGALAKPLRGFHEGPYLQIVSGARDASFDTNVADNTKSGHDIEATFGFLFGWNVNDPFSCEMQGTYSSAGAGNIQQHLIDARFSSRYSFITNALTNFRSLRILPYVDGGVKLQINVLPNAAAATSKRVIQWGTGPSFGGGMSFLFFHDAIYVSTRGGADIIRRKQIQQTIAGVPTVVYQGGWGVDWSTTVAVGVHF